MHIKTITALILGALLLPVLPVSAMTQTDLYASYALALNAPVALEVGAIDVSAQATATPVDIEATAETAATLSVSRDSTSGDTVVTSPTMVSTESDLEAFASSEMAADSQLEKVEFTSDAVTVWYTYPAQLLGFIPMQLSVQATVSADGTVSVRYPWYSFMTASASADRVASLENQIDSTMSGQVEGAFSARTQAQILSDVRFALGDAE